MNFSFDKFDTDWLQSNLTKVADYNKDGSINVDDAKSWYEKQTKNDLMKYAGMIGVAYLAYMYFNRNNRRRF